VKEFFSLAPGRMALDLAAGSGRHAIFLAEQGFTVEAVDISAEGLALFKGRHPAIRPFCADLDTFDIPGDRYDLIVNVLYLNRRLFPQIREALSPGGILIFETLIGRPAGEGGSDSCRDYFLRENELLHSFLALRILHYHEERHTGQQESRRLASLVAARE
jgi:SAM-dependent methyltransferase